MNGSQPTPRRSPATSTPLNVEKAVLERYQGGAREREEALCCPVNYDPRYLEILPDEIRERDYGCGDPSRFARSGDTVLDLGSGSGKICYILSQIVGSAGKVIGLDFNDEMLALARKYLGEMGQKLGYGNVEFRKGKIQDLALDWDRLDQHLAGHPVRNSEDLVRLRQLEEDLKQTTPLVPDESVDLIVSNCVLNLVRHEDKSSLFREMYRVLRVGGRVAISDIVADEEIPEALKNDPDLWSGCVTGAFVEEEFLGAFEEAGFHGLTLESWNDKPFRTVGGIEFRSITLVAHKGKEGPCWEGNQAVVYRGPWKSVTDDDNHRLPRGARIAVCEKTYRLYSQGPYRDDLIFIDPREETPTEKQAPFDCERTSRRHPRETKGKEYHVTTEEQGSSCEPTSGCC